jgi:hypothetical protein
MQDLTTILLAYTSVVLTIVGGILAFMLYHFLPVKSKVDTMWRELYGGDTGDGHIDESSDEQDSLRQMLEEARDRQEMTQARMDRVVRFLNDLSTWLDQNGDSDRNPPHVYEDNYLDEREHDETFYRGGTDDD